MSNMGPNEEPHEGFEVIRDAAYYDMWCLRPKGSRSFNDTIHFSNAKQAVHASHVIAD